jgi:hypothetical protein
MEFDLAHTLKTPTLLMVEPPTSTPTLDDFKEAVDTVLRDSGWFSDMVANRVDAELESLVDAEVDRRVERYFRNFDATDHVDFEALVENAVDNIDFDYRVDHYLDNNFDPEDYVKDAVSDYMNSHVDVEEIANEEVHEILKDTDFINALALAIINIRKAQAAERKTTNQGETYASL